MKKIKKFYHSFLIFIGFWLSPLSPWNDLFTNIPLAYLFALPFTFINEKLLFPMLLLGYWLSNIIGFILMQYGYTKTREREFDIRKDWKKYFLITVGYTFLVGILIYLKILPDLNAILEAVSEFENTLKNLL